MRTDEWLSWLLWFAGCFLCILGADRAFLPFAAGRPFVVGGLFLLTSFKVVIPK